MTEACQTNGVDFHCHLDLYPDHEAAIVRAETARIYTLTVTTTPKAWPRNHELTRGSHYVRAALGLHPQLVAERAIELPLWEQYLSETRYVGEVGLDAGPQFCSSLSAQVRVFRRILECCAEAGDKILSVHSVRSVPTVLDMVERFCPQHRAIIVLHWFTGSRNDARRATALGCYFSVNKEMTRSERGRTLIAELPIDRIITETDGPFTKIHGRPTEPADVQCAIGEVASVRKASVDSIAEAILTNLRTLLRSGLTLPRPL